MKSLREFVKDINELAQYYDMRDFQATRKRLHPDTRVYPYIFPLTHISRDEGFAYHKGGQRELQFNIALNKNQAEFRYGVAFCLKQSRNFRNPLNTLKPKISRLNRYLRRNESMFENMKFWAYQEPKGPSIAGPEKVALIPDDLIRNNVLLFWGKFVKWEKVQPEDVLRLFDRLLPIYEHVEGDAKLSRRQDERLSILVVYFENVQYNIEYGKPNYKSNNQVGYARGNHN
jgi:ribosomal protein S15P/S13E